MPGIWERLILFSPAFQSSQLTSLPLLLVNHQVHDEFKACLGRLAGSKDLRYELVVELVNEISIHPTWTLVPAMSKHIPVVYAQFLISNAPGQRQSRSQWSPGDGGPGGMVWGLLSLLQQFVGGGTLLGWNKSPRGWEGKVDTLILEVKTPKPVQGVVIRTRETRLKLSPFLSAPDVAHEILRYMSWIFSQDGQTIEYGKKVAACVKRIHLLLDGVETKMWDLEAISHLHPGDNVI